MNDFWHALGVHLLATGMVMAADFAVRRVARRLRDRPTNTSTGSTATSSLPSAASEANETAAPEAKAAPLQCCDHDSCMVRRLGGSAAVNGFEVHVTNAHDGFEVRILLPAQPSRVRNRRRPGSRRP